MPHATIFVNLPTDDLPRAMAFWRALGYDFDPRFTNEQAAALVLRADAIYAMLLTRPFFDGFATKPVVNAHEATEVLNCLSCDSREEVVSLVERAVAAGGKAPRPFVDHGFMVQHAFEDPDGHVWELVHMTAAPPAA